MSYNRFNNELPVPPHGYADWRAFYLASLEGFSALGDEMHPEHARVVVPTGNDDLTEIPYWKIAHYAAREQAEENAHHPSLDLELVSELKILMLSNSRQPSDKLKEWFSHALDKALGGQKRPR